MPDSNCLSQPCRPRRSGWNRCAPTGKIVLFNAVYTSYGQTNQYWTGGASAAARHGAVGVLVAHGDFQFAVPAGASPWVELPASLLAVDLLLY